jgi:very-short-patch-repair endonuclease
MESFKCNKCEKEYDNLKSLSNHRFQKHSIKPKDTYDEYVLNNEPKLCACGCGGKPKFLTITNGYRDYIIGHASRVNNNWGHNPEAIRKSHETQKKMHESGELTVWNKGLTMDDPRVRDNIEKVMSNPERGKNISKSLKGVPKSEEHIKNIAESANKRWESEEEREKQSHKRMVWMKENDYTVKSKIEEIIDTILKTLGLIEDVDYERQSYVRDIKAYYDFKIFNNNTYIEVDGDFWHCNPNTKHSEPLYEAQFKNLEKDKIKSKWCENNNFKLIRFWESDINNNIDQIIAQIKEIILA